ncbi:MAG: tagaturonate epimerase family protein [Planctomycetota bacterium]
MKLEKYSFGVGDRFGHQGKAQLAAIMKAKKAGIDIVPVWNKSYREHTIIHTDHASVRREADDSVKALGWTGGYYVDADHIGLKNVDLFVEASNFFTLDVADFMGKAATPGDIAAFVYRYKKYAGQLMIEGIEEPIEITESQMKGIAGKVLLAVQEAGKIYRHIASVKGEGNFVTEVSMDETKQPQSPIEMLFILAAIAEEGIPAQTIAPKFTGRFNKGVDYVGDVKRFTREFEEDLAVIRFAVKEFGLPGNLKLSVHSGSDKFSIYGPIKEALGKYNAGLHLKTAGTTWLEELIGLARAGGEGLEIAREVYEKAYGRFDELCGPYATVIDIDRRKLPRPETVAGWSGEKFANTLRHEQGCPDYDSNFRQLLHVGYKVAAEMGQRYLNALEKYEDVIAQGVTANIFERHIKRIFPD